jgi:hypothetical protein
MFATIAKWVHPAARRAGIARRRGALARPPRPLGGRCGAERSARVLPGIDVRPRPEHGRRNKHRCTVVCCLQVPRGSGAVRANNSRPPVRRRPCRSPARGHTLKGTAGNNRCAGELEAARRQPQEAALVSRELMPPRSIAALAHVTASDGALGWAWVDRLAVQDAGLRPRVPVVAMRRNGSSSLARADPSSRKPRAGCRRAAGSRAMPECITDSSNETVEPSQRGHRRLMPCGGSPEAWRLTMSMQLRKALHQLTRRKACLWTADSRRLPRFRSEPGPVRSGDLQELFGSLNFRPKGR